MNTRVSAIIIAFAFLLSACEISTKPSAGYKELAGNFAHPPESTKPWVYWYWLSDNISKEGITKDLEAMAKAGIGEAFIGNILDKSGQVPMGDVSVLSEEWWECLDFAIAEADRLDMKIGLFNCPGWSMAGGPWVKPEQSMRYLANNEIRVSGPKKIKLRIDNPSTQFQRVSIQAFPEPEGESINFMSRGINILSSTNIENPEALFDNNPETHASFISYPAHIEFELDKPAEIRSMELLPVQVPMSAQFSLFAKSEKGNSKKLVDRKIERESLRNDVGFIRFAPVAASFPLVKARIFRLEFSDPGMVIRNERLSFPGRLSEIKMSSAAKLSYYPEKQLAKMAPTPWAVRWDSYLWPGTPEPENHKLLIDEKELIDLNHLIFSGDSLIWDVPPGNWVILNCGMVPTGTKNHPVTSQGEGPEVDKMNKDHVKAHFNAYVGKLLKRIPPENRDAFRHVVADSYEQGSQNWTEGFAEEFEKRYGYSPIPWLPVFTGRIVGSADQSERFLWDIRRLVADMIAENFVGGFREISRQNNLRLWLQNYGHWGFPGEFLNYGGASEDISGEFWFPDRSLGPTEVRCASSAGHIYGKNIISGESFTSNKTFYYTPRDLKAVGAWAMTEGINHFVLHVYLHQAFYDKKPGISAWFGTDFNRNTTWFSSVDPYIAYLRRSAALLQSGIPVAEVAYFIGDDTPKMMGIREPELPRGYNYDYINYEVLMNDATVKNGKIILSSGASYSLLVLPPQKTIRPELLKKISQLVKKGAIVLGPMPEKSPSMKNYPKCDEIIKDVSAKLWRMKNGKIQKETSYGQGKVFHNTTIDEIFSRINLKPDITAPCDILYTHRIAGTTDIYFLSNQSEKKIKDTISFTVTDKQPELWDPVSGKTRMLPQFTQRKGQILIPLEFHESEAFFIVFSDDYQEPDTESNFPDFREEIELKGPWRVSFDTNYGAPEEIDFPDLIDWTSHKTEAVKYYSGKAGYKKSFEFHADPGTSYFLNLGRVEAISSIRLNGKTVETKWCYPYRTEISQYLKVGTNHLEIDIVNPWWNRLIGDEQQNGKKFTYTTYKAWDEDSPLQAAGLIGPVCIESHTNKNN